MSSDELTLFDYIVIFFRHIKLFAVVFVISFLCFMPKIMTGFKQIPLYEVKCVVSLAQGNMETEMILAQSRDVSSILTKEIYGTTDAPQLNLQVYPEKNCKILTFVYQNQDKNVALSVVRKWVKRYLMISEMYSGKNEIKIVTRPYISGQSQPNKFKEVPMAFGISALIGMVAVALGHSHKEWKQTTTERLDG